MSANKTSTASSSTSNKSSPADQSTTNSTPSSHQSANSSTTCVSVNAYPQTILSTTLQPNQTAIQTAVPLQPSQTQQTTTTDQQQIKSPISPTLNTNAQAALWILLTAQMQSQTGETSILQNPQVVGILQNLVSQAGNPEGNKNTPNSENGSNNLNDVLNHPALSSVFGSTTNTSSLPLPQQIGNWQTSINNDHSQNNVDNNPSTIMSQPQGLLINAQQHPSLAQRTTLLDTPKRPSLLGQAPPTFGNHSQQSHTITSPPTSGASSAPVINNSQNESTSSTPAILSNNLNNLLNAQNLSQLLGSLTGEATKQNNSPSNDLNPNQRSSAGQRPVLLTNPPSQNINVSQPSSISNGILMGFPTAQSQQQSQLQGPPQNQQIPIHTPTIHTNQFAQSTPSTLSYISLQQPSITTQSFSMSNQMANQQPANNYMAVVPPQSVGASQNPFLLSTAYNMAVPPPTSTVSPLVPSPAFVYGAPQIQPFGAAVTSNTVPGAQGIYGSYIPTSNVQVQPSSAQMTFGTAPIGTPASLMASYGAQQAFALPSLGVQHSTNIPNSLIPQQNSMVSSHYPSTPPPQQIQSPSNSVCGLKRKLAIPPSPENSPDGPFIGQHSQGIGGHYADSYWRNRTQNMNKRQRF